MTVLMAVLFAPAVIITLVLLLVGTAYLVLRGLGKLDFEVDDEDNEATSSNKPTDEITNEWFSNQHFE